MSSPAEHKEIKRLTISIDDNTEMILSELSAMEKRSISEIVRFAVADYYQKKNVKGIDPEYVDKIVELLSEREHVIVDVGLWATMLEEINSSAKDNFWKFVERLGVEYGTTLRLRGLNNVFDVLRWMEPLNWFRVKKFTSNTYIVVLTARAEVKLLSTFLQSLFKSINLPVEIIEGVRKLIVVEKSLDSKAEAVRKYLD